MNEPQQERTGSKYVQSGDRLFGRAVSVDGVGMLIGIGATLIPPGRKTEIIALRKCMRRGQAALDSDNLYQWDTEIRELYLKIKHSLHALPEIRYLPTTSASRLLRRPWYWTRRGMAEWLVERLTEAVPTIVGIDHNFSFPLHIF